MACSFQIHKIIYLNQNIKLHFYVIKFVHLFLHLLETELAQLCCMQIFCVHKMAWRYLGSEEETRSSVILIVFCFLRLF